MDTLPKIPSKGDDNVLARLGDRQRTLMLLLFASTKFCDFGIPMILRVLIFAISRRRAKYCDFAQPR